MNFSENYSHLSGVYIHFLEKIAERIDRRRIVCDPLKTLAYGTDASLYRLVPQLVVMAENETEVAYLLKVASELKGAATSGYSNSRTCEIGLSLHSGVSINSRLLKLIT